MALRVLRSFACVACALLYLSAAFLILALDIIQQFGVLAGLNNATFGDSSFAVMPLLRALTVAGGLYIAYRVARSRVCCICHGDRTLQDLINKKRAGG